MPTPEELLRRLADRGESRGAHRVFSAASASAAAVRRALLTAAAVLAVVAVGAAVTLATRDDSATVAAPGRAAVEGDIPSSDGARASVPATAGPRSGTGGGAGSSGEPVEVRPSGTGEPVVTHLESHSSCGSVLDRLRSLGTEAVGPYGFHSSGYATAPEAGTTADSSAGSGAGTSGGSDAPSHSTSNVQEPGVDEADLVKTDGRIVVTATRGRLQVVSVQDRSLLSSVQLEVGTGPLFLVDGAAVVIGPPRWGDRDDGGPETPLVVVDLRDPAQPQVRSTTWIEGHVRASRLHAGVVRLVVTDQPHLAFTTPTDDGPQAEREAESHNRQVVATSELPQWLPDYRTVGPGGELLAAGPAASCESTYTPSRESGFGTTTVVTLDPADGAVDAGTSVSASPRTVYANARSLYVVSSACCPERDSDVRADVHRFDLTDPGRAPYRASGSVPGLPVDQFALSERDGHLRIATTYFTDERADGSRTDSAVWVLDELGSELRTVGALTGLGKEGERIHSVRYHDDVAYVVTFRRTDPLYVVDLSKPHMPLLLGEAHVPGFSTHLQQVGSGRLLGVGRDADENGSVRGLQLSLFDVSDATDPRRAHALTYDGGHSAAEQDHLALLHWAPRDLVVVPMIEFDRESRCHVFGGALMLHVGDDGLTELARVDHADHADADEDAGAPMVPIIRSLVAGDRLLTVSHLGLAFGDLDDGTEEAFVDFEGSETATEYAACPTEPQPEPEPEPEPEPDDDGFPLPVS